MAHHSPVPSPPPTSPATSQADATRPAWDWVVSLLLLAGCAVEAFILGALGGLFGMAGDGCFPDDPCNDALMNGGVLLAVIGPAIVMVAVGIITLIRLSGGKTGWWVPLIGVLLAPGVTALAASIVELGVPD